MHAASLAKVERVHRSVDSCRLRDEAERARIRARTAPHVEDARGIEPPGFVLQQLDGKRAPRDVPPVGAFKAVHRVIFVLVHAL